VLRGPEPRRRWTRRGATLFLVGPVVVLALAVAVGLVPLDLTPLGPVLLLLAAALAAALLVRKIWRPRLSAPERARHYAWTLLAPRLHGDGFHLEDSAFLVGLAQLSDGKGFSPLRARLLVDLAQRTETAVTQRQAPLGHLVILRRLQAEDAARAGEDPVVTIAQSLARCFAGQIPLVYAQQLLGGWQTDIWTRGNLARLRVLLCESAFENGFEVCTLLEAAANATALRGPLDTAYAERLAALRLLWAMREKRPWGPWAGGAQTIFDIARDPRWTRLLAR
jgi:hypothetical protein